MGGLQVEATALSKHGSLEDLDEHRERQQLAKIRQRIAKRAAEMQKARAPHVFMLVYRV